MKELIGLLDFRHDSMGARMFFLVAHSMGIEELLTLALSNALFEEPYVQGIYDPL